MIQLDKLFKLALKSSPDMIFIKNKDLQYIAVSDENLRCFGYKKESDFVGKYDYEIFEPKLAQVFLIQDKKVIQNGETMVDCDWVEHKELGRILIESTKAPIKDDNGNIVGLIGISRNITKSFTQSMKSMSTKLQVFIENIPLAIWIKDVNNNYITMNKQYEHIFNINKKDVISQDVNKILTVNNLFSKDTIELFDKQNQKVISEKSIYKVVVTAKDSKNYTVIKSPIILENGKCVGSIGVLYEL